MHFRHHLSIAGVLGSLLPSPTESQMPRGKLNQPDQTHAKIVTPDSDAEESSAIAVGDYRTVSPNARFVVHCMIAQRR